MNECPKCGSCKVYILDTIINDDLVEETIYGCDECNYTESFSEVL